MRRARPTAGAKAKRLTAIRTLAALVIGTLFALTPARAAQSAAPARERTLTIASWNMEFLAERNGEGCRPRTDADYAALRRTVTALDADIIAFQEVENYAAAERVFDRRRYIVIMEPRRGQPSGACRGDPAGRAMIRQAVGFAMRRNLRFSVRYFRDLQLGDPNLRPGVDIGLRLRGGGNLRLLGVHLKSGCAGGGSSESCAILDRQIGVLERWIDRAARQPYRFIVLGDWNRRLALPGDAVWTELDDGTLPNADLGLAGAGATPGCDPRYTSFIDHFVLDRRAAADLRSFAEITFPPGERPSDHCPIVMRIAL